MDTAMSMAAVPFNGFNTKRKPNWSERELIVLAEAVTENISTIKGQFTPYLTTQDKNRCWEKIVERVNAVNGSACNRSVTDARKKWQDIQASTKKKEASRKTAMRMTGGGPAPSVTFKSWETAVLNTFTRTQLEGIEGGTDSMEVQQVIVTNEALEESSEPVVVPSTSSASSANEVVVTSEPQPEVEVNQAGGTQSSCGNPVRAVRAHYARKRSYYEAETDQRQQKFLELEEEKATSLADYRRQKLAIQERIAASSEKTAETLFCIFKMLSNPPPSNSDEEVLFPLIEQ